MLEERLDWQVFHTGSWLCADEKPGMGSSGPGDGTGATTELWFVCTTFPQWTHWPPVTDTRQQKGEKQQWMCLMIYCISTNTHFCKAIIPAYILESKGGAGGSPLLRQTLRPCRHLHSWNALCSTAISCQYQCWVALSGRRDCGSSSASFAHICSHIKCC